MPKILLFSLIFVGVGSHAAEYLIKDSPCSRAILERSGLSVSYLCLNDKRVSICEKNGDTFAQGAELDLNYLRTILKLNTDDLNGSLQKTCSADAGSKPLKSPPLTNCRAFFHNVLNGLLEGLSPNVRVCLCGPIEASSAALCVAYDGGWTATSGAFREERVRDQAIRACSLTEAKQDSVCACTRPVPTMENNLLRCLEQSSRPAAPSPMAEEILIRGE